MKSLNIFILLVLATGLISVTSFAAPNLFTYEGVLAGNNDEPIANQNASVEVSIVDTNVSPCVLYRETHAVTTDNLGKFIISIGKYALIANGTSKFSDATFDEIFAGGSGLNGESSCTSNSGNRYLRISINGITLSPDLAMTNVPYSLHANDSDSLSGLSGSSFLRTSSSSFNAVLSQPQADAIIAVANGTSPALSTAGTVNFAPLAVDPTAAYTSADKGKIWFDNTSSVFKFWNGSSAVSITAGGSGNINNGGNNGAIVLGSNDSSLDLKSTTDMALKPGGTAKMTLKSNGKVGIGTVSPATILEVVGTLKLADGAESCSIVGDGGMVRYNSNVIQFCNGTAWQPVAIAGAPVSGANISGTIGGATIINTTGNITTTGTLNVGASILTNVKTDSLKLRNGTFNFQLVAPALGADVNLTLPNSDGTSGQLLSTNGAGLLSWVSPSSAGLPLSGGTMTGAINMGGNDINNAGNVNLAASKYIGMGQYSSDPPTGGWGASEKGRTWFNTTSNSVKYWDGSAIQALGVSGAGLTSLGGLVGSTQTFATSSAGIFPAISSSGNVHTLNVPLANGAGVTSGTISKTEYDNFNGKMPNTSTGVTTALGYTPSNRSSNLSDVSSVATARTNLGLGTSAVLNVGTGSNDIVQLDGTAKLPAVDASQVTGLVSGQIPNLDGAKITTGTIASARIPSFSGDIVTAGGSTVASISASSVDSGKIADNSIMNLDISGSAAIARSKIAAATSNQILVNDASGFMTSMACPAGQFMYFTGGGFACQDIAPTTTNLPAGSSGAPSYSFVGDTNTGIYSSGADNLDFATAGVQRFNISSNGNIGIGNSAPASNLEVNGTFFLATATTGSSAIDFSTYNTIIYTGGSCSTMTLNNMRDGMEYTLIMTTLGPGVCTFSVPSKAVKYKSGAALTAVAARTYVVKILPLAVPGYALINYIDYY